MAVEDGAIGDALGDLAGPERREAGSQAEALARRLEFLTWADRAAALDGFFWGQAKARLRHETITAVINRRGRDDAASAAEIERYALHCRAVATAILARLGEPVRVAAHAAALTYRASLLEDHREAAEAWVEGGRRAEAERELARHPGYAFLLLAMSPNDSAESFAARDAFLAAMLGRA